MSQRLVADSIFGAEVFFCVLVFIRVVTDILQAGKTSNSESSAAKYMNQKDSQKWYYCSYVNSCIYSIYLCYIVVAGLTSCEPPKDHIMSGSILGDNMFTNKYCRD